MNNKIEEFIREVGMKESINPKINLYMFELGRLDKGLKYWKRILLENNLEVVNFFFDEKRKI